MQFLYSSYISLENMLLQIMYNDKKCLKLVKT